MKLHLLRPLAVLATGVALAACVHTPPGTSVEIALAKKPELIRLPAPPKSEVAKIKPVEPALPSNSQVEKVADAFTQAQFSMKAGKDGEAITAFEETVKLDPTFTDAWQSLALLYEKTGQTKKAMEAFRKSKKIAGR